MEESKLLIVDDEEHIRTLYEMELEEEGYSVITTASGYDVLRIIKDEKPDLVILDIKMVDYNGLEILQDIRNEFYELPVIICTAYDTFREDIQTISADFYVIKSYDLTEIKNDIKTALSSSLSIKNNKIKNVELTAFKKTDVFNQNFEVVTDCFVESLLKSDIEISFLRKDEYEVEIYCVAQSRRLFSSLRKENIVLENNQVKEIYETILGKINTYNTEAKQALELVRCGSAEINDLDETDLEELYVKQAKWQMLTFDLFCRLVNEAKRLYA